MKKIVALAVAGVFVLSACGSSEDTIAAFCDSQTELVAAVDAARGLTVGSTLDEIRNARDDVAAAWDDYKAKAQDVSEVTLDAADEAYGRYVEAVNAISSDATLAEAYATVVAAQDAYYSELDEIAGSVSCP